MNLMACHLHGVVRRRVTGMLSVAAGVTLIGICALISGGLPIAYADSELVRTESGKVRCDVQSDRVGCQYLPGFPQAPICDTGDYHCDIAQVKSSGGFSWIDGNIPGAHPENDVVLNYGQTYHLQGWTINPGEDGTRFTNDATGHGMFVSIENVSSF
jgi:hypothetical protein